MDQKIHASIASHQNDLIFFSNSSEFEKQT